MSIIDTDNNANTFRIRPESDFDRDYTEYPNSLIPSFENELRAIGLEFETIDDALKFLPRYKKLILPIAVRYYQLAIVRRKSYDQNYFMRFFRFRGFEEVVPMLLEDFHSHMTPDNTRWHIADCLFYIRSDRYIDDYIKIISNRGYGLNRQMFILLVGKIKSEKAVPILIRLLEDESIRSYAISALGDYKRESFRPHFERFGNSVNHDCRKQARAALRKLDAILLKR